MRADNKISQAELIRRLSRQMNYPIEVKHFAVLMHGWMRRRPELAPDVHTLFMRKKNNGYVWLTAEETASLSAYAGYDLTK